MKHRRVIPLSVLTFFLLACSCLPLSSLGGGGSGTPSNSGSSGQASAGYQAAKTFAGHWTGTWNNLTSSTTGGIDAVIDVQTDGTASLTLNLTGHVLGGVQPPQAVFSGRYDENGLFFDGTGVPIFGNLHVTIAPAGNFTMESVQLPTANIIGVAAQGNVSGEHIDLTYLVTFSNAQIANGSATLTRAQ
jgi:hypothetical protein